VADRAADDGLAPLFETLHRAIRAGVVWREQISLRRGDGGPRLLRITVAPAACGWSCWCEDVTWLMGGWLTTLLEALMGIVFSNALFPSSWQPEHGARRA